MMMTCVDWSIGRGDHCDIVVTAARDRTRRAAESFHRAAAKAHRLSHASVCRAKRDIENSVDVRKLERRVTRRNKTRVKISRKFAEKQRNREIDFREG